MAAMMTVKLVMIKVMVMMALAEMVIITTFIPC